MICIHISYEVRVFSFSATLSVMTIQEQLTQSIKEALLNLGIEGIKYTLNIQQKTCMETFQLM